MDKFSHFFRQVCKEKYTPLRFVLIRQTYSRIVNDVLQTFRLKKSRGVPVVTIEFGVTPLCMNVPNCDVGAYSLETLSLDAYANWGWQYHPDSQESVLYCIELLMHQIDLEVIPFFEKADCCRTALPEMISMDRRIEINRLQLLQQLGTVDHCSLPIDVRLLTDDKFYMALKAKNYDFVGKYLDYQIQHLSSIINEMESGTSGVIQPAYVVSGYREQLDDILVKRAKLDCGDVDYFFDMIQQNETASYQNLSYISRGKLC